MSVERGNNPAFDRRAAGEKMEVEANEFSAALLIPTPEFREERRRLGNEIDLDHLRSLKDTFDVSLEFMARTFVGASLEKLAVIISRRGEVRRLYVHQDFPYLGLRKGSPIPHASMTDRLIRSQQPGTLSDVAELGTAVWIEDAKSVTALYEQVLVQRDGWAMTMLTIEEDEADEDDDDTNWNRRNNRRFE